MAATLPTAQTEWVRLGLLNQRTDVNHRRQRNDKRIEEYIRLLMNGENPPPIKVHRRTKSIIDGQHRFLALKYYTIRSEGEKAWKSAQIEVEWSDDVPSPDDDPLMFEVATAAENRRNGEPLDEDDVAGLLMRLIKGKGKDEAKRCAPMLNQTPAYVESLYRRMYPAQIPAEFTARNPSNTSAPTTQQGPREGTSEAQATHRGAPLEPRTRWTIIELSRRLHDTLEAAPPGRTLTEREREELDRLHRMLVLKLDK